MVQSYLILRRRPTGNPSGAPGQVKMANDTLRWAPSSFLLRPRQRSGSTVAPATTSATPFLPGSRSTRFRPRLGLFGRPFRSDGSNALHSRVTYEVVISSIDAYSLDILICLLYVYWYEPRRHMRIPPRLHFWASNSLYAKEQLPLPVGSIYSRGSRPEASTARSFGLGRPWFCYVSLRVRFLPPHRRFVPHVNPLLSVFLNSTSTRIRCSSAEPTPVYVSSSAMGEERNDTGTTPRHNLANGTQPVQCVATSTRGLSTDSLPDTDPPD